jgi:DNA polymerase-1
MQLVDDHVFLYHTGRDKLYDAAGVEEDFGVPPHQVVEVLALMGDSVDNVPGVPGIGEKGAKKLIAEYGSVEELLGRADEVSRKSYREGLQEHAEQARLSHELVTIHTDAPVDFDPEALVLEEPDTDKLRELFREMEFHSLVEELADSAPEEPMPEAEEATTAEAWESALEAVRKAAGKGGRMAWAVLGEEEPLGLAVGAADSDAVGAGALVYADLRRSDVAAAALASVAAAASDPSATLVAHDVKEVLRCAWGELDEADPCQARLVDLMLVSYLLRPSQNHGLDELALERLGLKATSAKEVGWERGGEPAVGDLRLSAYAGERVELVRRLAGSMEGELADHEALDKVYREIEEPLVPVLLAMEENGILLDCDFLADMSRQLAADLEKIEADIYAEAGEELNINSPQQLGELMFEKLGYPVIKRTRKTKSYATGADVLEELAARGYPLPELILRFRELSKLKSTYVDALPELVGDDGRLHTRFNQAVAATGRLSSTNPNLQNIPVRTELGQSIRKAFVAPEGRRLLVADYSQIELRILAHIAGEKALVEAFRAGEDIHRATAAAVLGVAPALVNPEQRRAAKTINFGIIYGMSAFGLSKTLRISKAEAQKFIDAYFERYPGVKRYMDETLAAAEKEGGVETLYGRVRWLPDVHSKNWNLRENARRMAINARIQGTAADLMKKAMIAVHHRLAADHPHSLLLLTVHDELVLEVPEGAEEKVSALVRDEMCGVAELDVPLVVDLGVGRSWYDAKD